MALTGHFEKGAWKEDPPVLTYVTKKPFHTTIEYVRADGSIVRIPIVIDLPEQIPPISTPMITTDRTGSTIPRSIIPSIVQQASELTPGRARSERRWITEG